MNAVAAKRTLTMKIHVTGVRETLAAFNRLPKDANKQLREASLEIAQSLARTARSSSSIDAQSAAVGSTIRVARDRVPVVQVGGAKRVTSSGAAAWKLLFGSEFGATGRYGWYAASKYADSPARQFPSHQGRNGRWFFPAVEREVPDAMRRWRAAVDTIVRNFGAGG